jgi:DNA-binding MarR family transcriptional regulator
MPDDTTDPIDAIAAALSRLRGRQGRRISADPRFFGVDGRGRKGGGSAGAVHSGPPAPGGPLSHGGHVAHSGHGAHGGHGGHGGWGDAMAGRMAGVARLRLLETLEAASIALSVSAIADAIGVDQPRASRLVQQAVESGNARRDDDPEDARRTLIALTEAGRALVRGIRDERRSAVETALEGFDAAEREQLAALLTRLAAAWPRPAP